jgi:cytochrome c
MRRFGDDEVDLQIVRFDDGSSKLDDEKGKKLFEARCSVLRLATQVKGQMHQLLNEHGEDGYMALWGNREFPMQEFKRLTTLIEDNKLDSSGKMDRRG